MRAAILLAFVCQLGLADDWPTFRHDNRRSSVTAAALAMPLETSWVYRAPAPPQTAWSGPAKWDAYASNADLQSMRNFDPAFFVTVVDDQLTFGSSVDNAVHALDATTGKERWLFFTNAAVRFPPTWHEHRLYFGSDDGKAFCIDSSSGVKHWQFSPVEDTRQVPSNGKLISLWPCRTGVMVHGSSAYFGASLLPWESSYLCALDLRTGKPDYVAKQNGVTLQGALLSDGQTLYVPQGRAAPLRYALSDGKALGSVGGAGGTYCLLTPEQQFISGPENQKQGDHVLRLADGGKNLLTFRGANRILVAEDMAYLHEGKQLVALKRLAFARLQGEQRQLLGQQAKLRKAKKSDPTIDARLKAIASELQACYKWRIPKAIPIGVAKSANAIFVGLDGSVEALDADSGEQLWQAPVAGKAYGLAIASGRLFVSTDRGTIHCFVGAK
jgi:outer membrane protein assembly factor BamB